jgi:hypothetical protein
MVYFKTKNPNLGKIWRAFNVNVGLFYGPLVYFGAIWYILGHLVYFRPFGIYFPVLVSCTERTLATLDCTFPHIGN